MEKIHTTVGLYPSGDWKKNGVLPEHLENHIQYNKEARPGRALIVDGKCVHKGIGVPIEEITKHEKMFLEVKDYKMTKCTAPYS